MIETIEKRIQIISGVQREVTVTKRFGHDTYVTPKGLIEADEYVEHDYGPKLGVSKSYGIYPSNVTPEQIANKLKQIQLLAGRIAVGC